MAKNIGARKCDRQVVICSRPSMNKTPMGNSTPPVAYYVMEDLSGSVNVSPDVNLNSNPAFTMASDTVKVTGDAPGTAGGTGSGTTGAKAEPIEHSKSVRINGKLVVRCGDEFYMNNKNTKGFLTCKEFYSVELVLDNGKVAGYCTPGDSLEDQLKSMPPDKSLRQKFMDAFNDPETGYKQTGRDLYGENVASWITDDFADFVNGINKGIDTVLQGNIGGALSNLGRTVIGATPAGKGYKKVKRAFKGKKGKGGKKKEDGMRSKGTDCKNANKNKGDCAEKILENELRTECESLYAKDLMNASGHGFDHAFKCKGGLVFAETKGTTEGGDHIPLSKSQRDLGGAGYVKDRLDEMRKGVDGEGGKWSAFEGNKYFDSKLKRIEKAINKSDDIEYRKCRVWVEEDKTGCYKQAKPIKSKKKGKQGKCRKKKGKRPNPKCEPWDPPKK